MKASELTVKCLENENVDYIFGIPGEENLDLMDALLESDIQFIQTRDERGAAFMADVYGRLTGRAGVCLATLGPGAMNLVTGVADANMDRAPLIAITGQASLDRMHKESHQYMDVVSVFKPMTKWNTLVHLPEIIPESISKAFKIATGEKPGATHIDFPEDVASMQIDAEPISHDFQSEAEPVVSCLQRAAALINDAKQPIILAGNGVVRQNAARMLTQFAEMTNIPVAHTFMGKGSIPWTHRLSLLSVGLQAHDFVSCGFDRADLVIAIGYDIVEYHPRLWNPNRDKKLIHIDTQPSETDASYITDVEMVGNIRQSLRHLMAEEIYPKDAEYASNTLRKIIIDQLNEHRDDRDFPMKPQKILSDVRSVLAADDIVISDVGAHKMWIARMYPCYQPNTCIISNGFAAMGIALPGAFVAKLIHPERKCLAICGDGGFMMNSQELETAVRTGVPFVTLIFNDEAYGLIEWKQMNGFGRPAHIDFTNPDFVKYAEAFGAKGYRVEASDELVPILNDAFSQKVPSVIDCPVNYAENLRLTDELGQLTCPI
ncbi:acetolactate synthase large subunit [Candidatus Poribacteria bacterium]|nr:MAG: acetolactate synthase large subunit [Candidatus Poribacteria bacterium]